MNCSRLFPKWQQNSERDDRKVKTFLGPIRQRPRGTTPPTSVIIVLLSLDRRYIHLSKPASSLETSLFDSYQRPQADGADEKWSRQLGVHGTERIQTCHTWQKRFDKRSYKSKVDSLIQLGLQLNFTRLCCSFDYYSCVKSFSKSRLKLF